MSAVRNRGALSRRVTPAATAAVVVLALATAPAGGADFAPITDAERALTAAPGDPEAPAVVLFEKGRMKLLEYPRDFFSQLDVEVRVKVFNDRGKEMFGEVEIEHGRHLRLSGFKGRTVLPDGREVPVGEDAVFEDVASRARRFYVTRVAFPAVEPGAILDYRYTLRWDTFLYLEPWYFSNRVPTLHSEITYVVPPNMSARPWARQVNRVELHTESNSRATGREIRVWADGVPAVAEEPFSFPFADLASRYLMLPLEVTTGGTQLVLLRSWDTVCEIASYGYGEVRNNKGEAKRKARELTAGITGERAKAEAIYRFVRDEIRFDGFIGVFTGTSGRIDKVLADRRGSSAEQALVLEEMLDSAGLKPRLVWSANRLDGRIDVEAANPWWFERVLVMVELDGERVFLDPLDRDLGFGQLAPGFEGMQALLFHKTRPEVIELPAAPAAANARRAEVTLAVGADGGIAGSGTLSLTGHHAWVDLSLRDGDADPAEAWRRKLESSFDGYRVGEVEVADAPDRRSVTVTWTLDLREENVLDDEATLSPSLPVGPQTQLFTLPPERRRTPVQLPFADLEEVDLRVTWPEGWSIEIAPPSMDVRTSAGVAEQQVEVDAAARTLTYRRRLEVSGIEFTNSNDYGALRNLIAAAAKADAQPLVLSVR
jgi:transglutaminase-like putative cysteine protease